MEKPILVSIAQAAKLLGLGRSKLYLILGDGSLETVKIGSRRLVKVSSIEAFLEQISRAEGSGSV